MPLNRLGTPEYRDQPPRISLELSEWLVKCEVALIGVEPPSAADVNNMTELSAVYRTLFGGEAMIVAGLTNLDLLTQSEVGRSGSDRQVWPIDRQPLFDARRTVFFARTA